MASPHLNDRLSPSNIKSEIKLLKMIRFKISVVAHVGTLFLGTVLVSTSYAKTPSQETALDALLNKFGSSSSVGKSPAAKKSKSIAPESGKSPDQAATREPASSTSAKPSSIKHRKALPTQQPPSDGSPGETSVTEQETKKAADPEAAQKEEDPFSEKLFGDWGGLRRSAADKGIEIELVYKSEFTGNFAGGSEKKDFHLQNFDIWTNFDLEKIVGIKGLSLTAYGLGDFGGKPSEVFGEVIVSSNIEAPNTFKLYEIYFTKSIDDRLLFTLGTRDLNADFFATDSSATFRNSAFGISTSLAQTGVNGPSIFPTTSLAIVGKYENPNLFYFSAGAFNAEAGNPDNPIGTHINSKTDNGYLYIWEAGYIPQVNDKNMKLSLGAWTYSKPQDPIDSEKSATSNSGFYLLADYPITKETSGFIRFGTASPEINQLANETQVGIKIDNPIAGREKDSIAIGVVRGQTSSDERLVNSSVEFSDVYEIAYEANVVDGLTFSPSYQYITNPGLQADQEALSIWAARFTLDF